MLWFPKKRVIDSADEGLAQNTCDDTVRMVKGGEDCGGRANKSRDLHS